MRRLKPGIIVMVLLLLPVLAGAAPLGELRVSLAEGDGQFMTEDTGDWVPVSVNTPLREGDRIWVPDNSRLELTLRDGTSIRLDENSSLDILTLDRDSSQFYLGSGSAYVNFTGRRDRILQFDTPLSDVRTYERTIFRIDVPAESDTEISVFSGVVFAESRSGRTRVPDGRMLLLREGDDYAELAPLGDPDSWERWNRDRDARIYGKKSSSQYLPDALDSYAYDFDDNGRWVNVREYGYVWTPTAHISAGWAPYRNGRWTWIGGDYVWIGYEPWGWVPYHYGRWVWITSVGWCWVPPARDSVYWGPGYVGWVDSDSYVSWVPLAPGEIYFGYGNYGPNSINISISTARIDKRPRYRNAFVRDGVTIMHHDTFYRGRHVDKKLGYNPFEHYERGKFGRPAVRQEKAVRMPVIKEPGFFKSPPKRVVEMKVRQLRNERPFVREKDRSVFRPGAALRNLQVKELKERPSRDRRRAPGDDIRRDTRERGPVRQPAERMTPAEQTQEQRRQNPMYQQQRLNEGQPADRRQTRPPEGQRERPEVKPQTRPDDSRVTPPDGRGEQRRQQPAVDQRRSGGERPAVRQQEKPAGRPEIKPAEGQREKKAVKTRPKPDDEPKEKGTVEKEAPAEKKSSGERGEEQRRQNPMYQQQR